MKVAIVILAILIIAFAVAAGRHAPTAKALPGDSPDWLKSLGARAKPKFDFGDISKDCFDQPTTTFQVPRACVIRVAKSSTKFRQLSLQVKQGVAATIDFQPAQDDDSGLSFDRRTLSSGGSAETLILPAVGGSLTIMCVPPTAVCSVNAG